MSEKEPPEAAAGRAREKCRRRQQRGEDPF